MELDCFYKKAILFVQKALKQKLLAVCHPIERKKAWYIFLLPYNTLLCKISLVLCALTNRAQTD